MKTTLRIARLELNMLFYSPIAWLILVIFVFQTGLTFADTLDLATRVTLKTPIPNLTAWVFSGSRFGLYTGIIRNLYLYIPLITMGLMSRELSTGSVKLLFSSPITIGQIVAGKFLSMAIYGFFLIAILFCFGIAGAISIEHMDITHYLSMLLATYLLIGTYAAIGLFMSCLTSYQVVAAISTLVVFAGLNFIGGLGQALPFLRDILAFVSIAGRTGGMINGLIRSNDVFYFLIIIVLFLGLSYLKLLHGRESRPTSVKVFRYTAFIVTMVLFGYVISLPALRIYIDTTATKQLTPTKNTRDIIKKMDQPLSVTMYVNMLDQYAYRSLPANINENKGIFEQYTRYKPDIGFNYVWYYDSTSDLDPEEASLSLEQQAKKAAGSFRFDFAKLLTPTQIRKQIDLRPEENRTIYLARYNGRQAAMRLYMDQALVPKEREISAAFKRLLTTVPKIYFLTGHGERSVYKDGDKNCKTTFRSLTFRSSLINQGFDVDSLNLAYSAIPADITALVIADPLKPIPPAESAKIVEYINRGGNLFLAGKHGRQDLLNGLLRPMGVQLAPGMVFHSGTEFAPDLVTAKFIKPAPKDSAEFSFFYDNKFLGIVMPGTTALDYADTGGYRHVPVILADDNSFSRPGNEITDSTQAIFDPAMGDVKKPMVIGLALTRPIAGKQQRIMVLGSADLIANSEVFRNNIPNQNLDFNLDIFKWFSNGEFPIDANHPDTRDNKLLIGQDQTIWLRVTFLGVIPALIALLGSITLVRRRKQ